MILGTANDPIAISVKDAAICMNIGSSTVYRLLRRGYLDGFKSGHRRLITTASIVNFVENIRAAVDGREHYFEPYLNDLLKAYLFKIGAFDSELDD